MNVLHGVWCFLISTSAILFSSHLGSRSIPFGILAIVLIVLSALYTLHFVLSVEDTTSFSTLGSLSALRFFISIVSSIDDRYFGNRKGYMYLCIGFLFLIGISFFVRGIREDKQSKR